MREFIQLAALTAVVLVAGFFCTIVDAIEARRGSKTVRGKAAWYGEGYRGKTMANGQLFDPDARTCATWDFELGAVLRVRSLITGRVVLVTVTDRGPDRRLRRLVDLSARAFREIADPRWGVTEVEVEVLAPAEEPKPSFATSEAFP